MGRNFTLKGNTMTTAQDWERRRKRWDAYKARVAKRKAREAKTDKDETSGDEYRNHQGDGASGFDYWHDTHRHC